MSTPVQKGGAAYTGALEAIFAILIASGVGFWADDTFGTGPRYLLMGIVIGFAAFVVRLFRLRRLLELEEAPENDTKDQDHE